MAKERFLQLKEEEKRKELAFYLARLKFPC